VKQSGFFDEIAAHLSGARNDPLGKRFWFLNRDLDKVYSFDIYLKWGYEYLQKKIDSESKPIE